MLEKESILKEIKEVKDLKNLEQIYRKYLGKKGKITLIFRTLKDLPKEKRIKIAKDTNGFKNLIEGEFKIKREVLKKESQKESLEKIDITLPGKKVVLGHLHPLTKVLREVNDIFSQMDFEIVEGPEIENEYNNFDALNIPKDHPARDLWDTFWLKNDNKPKISVKGGSASGGKNQKLLLRTHTSPVQIRYMESHNPPLKIIAPGNVFRHEATDASHEFQLYQVEGLMVDKEVSVANFKAAIGEFFARFFRKEVAFRLRPDFFPFTEPSFDISVRCLVCQGKGCSVCKKTGWVETAGAGMVHPNVFRACKLNPKEWRGWAFGFGLERLAMMKYKIDDIRLFRSGDLRFIDQF